MAVPPPVVASQMAVPLFGVVIPGSPVRIDFLPADVTGLKYTLSLAGLPVPVTSVSDLVFFFLPEAAPALPAGYGATLYWQASTITANGPMVQATGFEMLGAITPDKPSGVFRTGWSTHDALVAAVADPGANVAVTLGVSIEPLATIQNLQASAMGVEDRMDVAKKIAMDLFNYMQSFDDTGARAGFMQVPINVFDRWLTRFESKFRIDPNFFMKRGGD